MAALVVGFVGFVLGSLAALSFNVFSDIRPLAGIEMFSDKGFFDVFAFLATDIIMPLGGLMIAVFAGWIVKTKYSLDELFDNKSNYFHVIWLFLVRYVAPVLLIVLFYQIITA
jgi:NSS family neurotransmitter:Na+ symporter